MSDFDIEEFLNLKNPRELKKGMSVDMYDLKLKNMAKNHVKEQIKKNRHTIKVSNNDNDKIDLPPTTQGQKKQSFVRLKSNRNIYDGKSRRSNCNSPSVKNIKSKRHLFPSMTLGKDKEDPIKYQKVKSGSFFKLQSRDNSPTKHKKHILISLNELVNNKKDKNESNESIELIGDNSPTKKKAIGLKMSRQESLASPVNKKFKKQESIILEHYEKNKAPRDSLNHFNIKSSLTNF